MSEMADGGLCWVPSSRPRFPMRCFGFFNLEVGPFHRDAIIPSVVEMIARRYSIE